MTSVVEEALSGAVENVKDAVESVFRGHPAAPPPTFPPPAEPWPGLPPQDPPWSPPMPPLIVCPPMAPPPSAPPGFHVWAAQVPSWFWWMFIFMFLVACGGTAAIVYILRELRRQRRGERVPGVETAKSLAQLEGRLAKRGY